MVEMLLKKGARVNDRFEYNQTLLHIVCHSENELKNHLMLSNINDHENLYISSNVKAKSKLALILLKHGANYDAIDEWRNTPLAYMHTDSVKCLVKEFAAFKFESESDSIEAEDSTHSSDFKRKWVQCFHELQRMKDINVYNDITLYEIFSMRKQIKRLTLLTKNAEFLQKFEWTTNNEVLNYYDDYLKDIVRNAINKREILESEEKKIIESGLAKKFSLPTEIVQKIAYITCEEVFFE